MHPVGDSPTRSRAPGALDRATRRLRRLAACASLALATGAAVAILAAPASAAVTFGPPGKIFYSNGSELYSINPDGTDNTDLGLQGSGPSVSPDGTKLAYAYNSQIWVANTDGSDAHSVATGAASGPSWSPDNHDLAFVHDDGNGSTGHIVIVDTANNNATTTLANPTLQIHAQLGYNNIARVAWSPDGSQIAYSTYGSESEYDCPGDVYYPDDTTDLTGGDKCIRDSTIGVVDTDGSNVTQLNAGQEDANPTWFPGSEANLPTGARAGNWLMFSSDGLVANADASLQNNWNVVVGTRLFSMGDWDTQPPGYSDVAANENGFNAYVSSLGENLTPAPICYNSTCPSLNTGWDWGVLGTDNPSWSPDGTQAAFTLNDVLHVSTTFNTGDPYGMNFGGGAGIDLGVNASGGLDWASEGGTWTSDLRAGDGSWTGPSNVNPRNLPGGVVKQVVQTNDSSGNVTYVVIGADNDVYAATGGGSSFAQVMNGGQPVQASRVAAVAIPASASTGAGDVQLVAVGVDGQIYHNILYPDGSWQGWNELGAPTTGRVQDLSIAATPEGATYLAAVGANGDPYVDIRNSDGSWSGWQDLRPGDGTATHVAIATDPSNGDDAYIVMSDKNGVWFEIGLPANNNYGGWTNLGSYTAEQVAVAVPQAEGQTPQPQVAFLYPSGGVLHEQQNTDGSWPGFQYPVGLQPAQSISLSTLSGPGIASDVTALDMVSAP